jgi:hypothetical protein
MKRYLRAIVSSVAKGGELLFAIAALATRNLERGHNTLTWLQVGHIRSNTVNDTHELLTPGQ